MGADRARIAFAAADEMDYPSGMISRRYAAGVRRRVVVKAWALLLGAAALFTPARALDPIPDKLVVLTFDDSVASHYSVVRPILKRYGFGATFFITEGFSFQNI